jgi:hypothetical protein
VAGIAREMAITGDWLVPRLNGREFIEYPPLGYYPIALSLSLGGAGSLGGPRVEPHDAASGCADVVHVHFHGRAGQMAGRTG